MAANEVVTFGDPPINEVALGVVFLPRPDFLLPYFGVFWNRVKARFPKAEHAAPIFDQSSSLEPFFLPRVWLVSEDSATLLQLQQDRFHFNWRQTDKGNDYVRFSRVQAEFLNAWNEFERYVLEATGQPLQPVSTELTYINFITVDGVTDTVDLLQKCMRGFRYDCGGGFLPKPSQVNTTQVYPMPDGNSNFKIAIATAKHKASGTPGLRVDLTVTAKRVPDQSIEDWSTAAHDYLVTAFKDITTEAMHEQWKLRG